MALNRDFIGRSRTADEIYEVTREKIREFALAIGDPNPVCLDADAAKAHGHSDVVAPPTFVTMVPFRLGAWPLTDADFGKRREPFIVHREQSAIHHRSVQAGDRLLLTSTVTEIREIGQHERFTVEHDISTEAGEPVCTLVDVAISRGTAGTGDAR
jgi:acyl dehydratase